jgi:hypothetical protein
MTEAEKTDIASRLHDLLRANPDVIFSWEDLYDELGITEQDKPNFRMFIRRGAERFLYPWVAVTTSRGRPTGDLAGVTYVPEVKTVRELYDLVSRIPRQNIPLEAIQHLLLGLMGELG